ncbi:MAG: hypothetical protein ACRDLM_03215 [Gaiellaceae bacterium]
MGGELIEGEPVFDAPVLDPVVASTLGTTGPDDVDHPLLMGVALDLDELPGLAEAFALHRNGHRFDVESLWSVLVSADTEESPTAYLHVRILDIDLRFVIRFRVDEYKRSLTTAAQTGLVELWEPGFAQAILTQPAEEAYTTYGAIGITPGDADPLRRVLQQRFDLPIQREREQPVVVEPGQAREALDRFIHGAAQPQGVGLVTGPGFAAVVIVDPSAAEVIANAGPESERWGHWASMQAGPIALARADVLTGERTRLGSWLLPNPEPEIVQATSTAPHVIVVLTEPLPDDHEARWKAISDGTAFPVKEGADAMRALRVSGGTGT